MLADLQAYSEAGITTFSFFLCVKLFLIWNNLFYVFCFSVCLVVVVVVLVTLGLRCCVRALL